MAEAAFEKAKALVAKMTNAQKVKVITGQAVSASGIDWPGLVSKDGVAGINQNFL
jgi:hypothetical protein